MFDWPFWFSTLVRLVCETTVPNSSAMSFVFRRSKATRSASSGDMFLGATYVYSPPTVFTL